ncbi:glycoside hydrolase family 88/105 protein [Jeotgalibaca caeni]|uniref:glycoside hydrolase family 88/105 protein n=1 Tax=Jeotgalibaca caeni TaxID=3028623 RepID=UPI00237E95B6|nr:glycoside hydrolase family 88 protein [Jeotgalibaca caeni]MDE1548620.1 glycoside hydrolase family 88 protein [Jeotgalibaca caeni]
METNITVTKEQILAIAEKSCRTLMKKFTPRELPPAMTFHYHQSVFLLGMLRVWEETGNEEYFTYIKGYYDALIDDEGNFVYERDQLDSIQVGILLFKLHEVTGHKKYMIAARKLRSIIDTINRTSENGFWHKDKYPYQMWLDGLFMAGPFLVKYANQFHEKDLIQTVLYQERLMRKNMTDSNTGLLFHAWDEKKVQPWADKETGCSPEFWGRSVGWYGTALIDIIEAIGDEYQGQNELPGEVAKYVENVVKFQDEKTGLWHQIVDKGDREDNWLESSSSSLYLYTIAKALHYGFVGEEYKENLLRGYAGLIEHMTEEAGNDLHLHGICIGTSAGSYEYYVDRPTSTDDLHGVGAFLLGAMAVYEYLED